jgi:acyl-CoA reductase-like NAD-dependent aldehyde dehydrogenase
MGGHLENVAADIDCHSNAQPLGVAAGICPFNFPAMVPLWMFPVAIAAGNTFVLKPSEKDPGAAMALADLALRAGLPPGAHGFPTPGPAGEKTAVPDGGAAACAQGARNHVQVRMLRYLRCNCTVL